MLKQRVITAIVLVIVFLSCLFVLPPVAFQGFVLLMFAIAAWEFSLLAGLQQPVVRITFSALLTLSVAATGYFLPLIGQGAVKTFFSAAALWWALALLWVQGYPSSVLFWRSILARVIMGLLTLVPAGVGVLMLHSADNGQWLVLALLALVAAADTGAYFSGKALGRRKLAPNVSPGKSWEGVMGGLIFVACLALAYSSWVGNHWYLGLAIALPAAAVSVLGDLFESMLKRHCGVKDSGVILPGHGGVLDRIDGVTAAAPVFVLALLATGWAL
ncbi:phosphatidate cytidylyltransferase [Marinagarivorans algicola]|uniref:phosphatidate cytidylyltransferase n=1 Tax=Marinagarivorans algicola TaxID=1513270 RepID=UPI0006B89219|nr:phosphatidate cytidylyltransferase [Marinagarivorans algicola]